MATATLRKTKIYRIKPESDVCFIDTGNIVNNFNKGLFTDYANLGDSIFQMFVDGEPIKIYWSESTLKESGFVIDN